MIEQNILQQLMDGMSAKWQVERANTQITLGEIRGLLAKYEKETQILGISSMAGSYRGYYCDVAFAPGETTVEELTAAADETIGMTLEGYKGGDFVMGKSTPTWVASYGQTGKMLMGFSENEGTLVAVLEDEEH